MKLREAIIGVGVGGLLAVLKLRALLALVLLMVSTRAGFGADTANFHVIGFSKSARWFAFTEFAALDGSGLSYVRTYVLDTKENRWAPGTPVSVELADGTMFDAHDRAQGLVGPILQKLGIRYPGRTFVVNPMHESGVDAGTVTFKPDRSAADITLSAGSFPVTSKADCRGAQPVGLKLTGKVDGKASLELYRDKFRVLPKSRRCATHYAIAGVYGAPGAPSLQAVALIYVSSPGYEGEDNFLTAVPITLPAP